MTSSSNSGQTPSKKRALKAESDSDGSSPPHTTPSKKAKSTPESSSTKSDAWTPELRLKLFEAYQAGSQIKWEEVAGKVGNGRKTKECREQWPRATGKRIKAALAEKN